MSLGGGDWLRAGFSVLLKWFKDSTKIIRPVYLVHRHLCVSGHVVFRVIRCSVVALRDYPLPASG